MKISTNWLNDYIKTDKSATELADLLTFSGTLVEEVISSLDSKVIVAKILEIKDHPNADRLHLAIVDTGSEKLEIVCGAPNIEAGQIVPLAQIGTKFGDFEIKEAEIRGVKSHGMLCSEKELGISDSHEGIMILPDNYELGKPLSNYVSGDNVLDIEITPNRGDCLSHLGIAREVSALVDKKQLEYKPESIDLPKGNELKVLDQSEGLCAQYHGLIITGIKIGPSPDWLKARLQAVGGSSINNLVDITNYIMYDLGQPLHAFDRKKVSDDTIIVRKATEKESIVSIDGKNRALSTNNLVIADAKVPVAIAGVMGGYDSEIDENTTEIILESAQFDRRSVRKTAKDLALTTEASYRFERGIDGDGVLPALQKAAKMIVDLCGGKIVDYQSFVNDTEAIAPIPYSAEKINDLLGTELKDKEMSEMIESLGFEIENNSATPPSWRHDVSIWQDLSEEVGRLYDLNKIKPVADEVTAQAEKSDYFYKEAIKDILVELGFTEISTYPFISDKDLKESNIPADDLVEVANPIQPENKYMRKALTPGVLKTIAKNPAFDPVQVFEVGNVFNTNDETCHIAIAVAGKKAKDIATGALKKIAEASGLVIEYFELREISRDELTLYKIRKPLTYICEVRISAIIDDMRKNGFKLDSLDYDKPIVYRPVSRFPSMVRDIALIVDADLDANLLIKSIYEQSEMINRVELFDEFASDKFGAGKKNIAFHIDLQDQKKTLTDAEADSVIKMVTEVLATRFGAALRTF